MDILFVLGTMLETVGASTIVYQAIQKNIEIVEINPFPLIKYHNAKSIKAKSEDALP